MSPASRAVSPYRIVCSLFNQVCRVYIVKIPYWSDGLKQPRTQQFRSTSRLGPAGNQFALRSCSGNQSLENRWNTITLDQQTSVFPVLEGDWITRIEKQLKLHGPCPYGTRSDQTSWYFECLFISNTKSKVILFEQIPDSWCGGVTMHSFAFIFSYLIYRVDSDAGDHLVHNPRAAITKSPAFAPSQHLSSNVLSPSPSTSRTIISLHPGGIPTTSFIPSRKSRLHHIPIEVFTNCNLKETICSLQGN